MTAPIVNTTLPIVIVGAGQSEPEDIETARKFGSLIVAADGGAERVLASGFLPDAVIGDLDSLSGAARRKIPPDRLHPMTEQETTDFDKCLRLVEAPLVIALGVAGPRLDHTLATFNSMVRHREKRVVVLGRHDLVFHAPGYCELDVPSGTRFSLFPMAAVTGRSEGLRWPIDGIEFAPGGRIGTSNVATGTVRLSFDGPGMLVIMPRQMLSSAVAALQS